MSKKVQVEDKTPTVTTTLEPTVTVRPVPAREFPREDLLRLLHDVVNDPTTSVDLTARATALLERLS